MTKLEMLRRIKDFTQENLGKEVLYSRTVISHLESGKIKPAEVHPRLRRALETYFGRSLEDLLTEVR